MVPEELGKVRPTTLLLFTRVTKRFSCPMVILGLCILPNIHDLRTGHLRPSTPKVNVKLAINIINCYFNNFVTHLVKFV